MQLLATGQRRKERKKEERETEKKGVGRVGNQKQKL